MNRIEKQLDHAVYRVKSQLLENNISPKLQMRNVCEVRCLKTRNATIHTEPEFAEETKQFAVAMKIPYKMEGLPSVTLKAMLILLRPKRTLLTDEQKKNKMKSLNINAIYAAML